MIDVYTSNHSVYRLNGDPEDYVKHQHVLANDDCVALRGTLEVESRPVTILKTSIEAIVFIKEETNGQTNPA